MPTLELMFPPALLVSHLSPSRVQKIRQNSWLNEPDNAVAKLRFYRPQASPTMPTQEQTEVINFQVLFLSPSGESHHADNCGSSS